MSRPGVVGLAVLLVLSTSAVAASAGPAATDPGVDLATQGGFDSTTFEIRAFANGSVRWSFVYARALENDTEREQFREFADRFNSEETDLYLAFQNRAELLASEGSNVTGRSMDARDFHRQASVNTLGNQGVVEMSFVWTNFSVVTDDRVVLGDVFDGGLYLAPDQRLIVTASPSLAFDDVDPPADSRSELPESESATWFGERQFADDRPRVAFVPAATLTTTTVRPGTTTTPTSTSTPTPTPTSTTTAEPDPTEPTTPSPTRTDPGTASGTTVAAGDGGGGNAMFWVVALLLLVGGLAGAAAYRRDGGRVLPGGGSDGGASSDTSTASAGEATTTAEPAEPAVPDEELLTDEDRVLSLLEENGGRMKQVDIVDQTDWSKSKVSMLLSDMEEDGQISKLRVGRENIISLSGHEPDAAGSPFDEE